MAPGAPAPRPWWFLWAFAAGGATCATLSLTYYLSGGCAASRAAGRANTGRQVSDQMCCPVGRVVGAVGLPLTSALALAGLAQPRRVAQALTAALGRCCCCCCCSSSGRGASSSDTRRRGCDVGCDVGPHVVAATAVSALGNVVLGVFDLCWIPVVHLLGALCFFGSGYVVVGLLSFSRDASGRLALFSLAGTRDHDEEEAGRRRRRRGPWRSMRALLKPAMLASAVAAAPVARLDTLTGEWCAIAAVGLALLCCEFDIQAGERRLWATTAGSSSAGTASSSGTGCCGSRRDDGVLDDDDVEPGDSLKAPINPDVVAEAPPSTEPL